MPDRTPRDVRLDLRVTEAARDALDELADAEQRTRSDMARILLGEALAARQAAGRPRRR